MMESQPTFIIMENMNHKVHFSQRGNFQYNIINVKVSTLRFLDLSTSVRPTQSGYNATVLVNIFSHAIICYTR